MRINKAGIAATIVAATLAGSASAQDCPAGGAAGLMALEVDGYTVLGHVPESAVGQRVPLVINLHPTGGTGFRTLNASKHVADEKGFVMIAPTGVIGPVFMGWTWNVPGVPTFGGDNYPAEDARNDVEFIAKAIDAAETAACIDPARVYVMGYSGGGRMASALACSLADRIASVVPIGGIRFSKASDTELGLPHAVECTPARPVPMQAIHGHWDATNPWFDEALGDTPFKDPAKDNETIVANAPRQGSSWSYSGQTALQRWVENNGCDPEPQVKELAKGVEERDYQNCKDDAEVSLVFFDGLGHAIPGYEEPWSPGQADSPLDGYGLAWDLMQDDRLPQ
ncbi:alpha/beta hydrolase family esterase [Paracoccus sp. (in: a-proteobacteria)]|uniref:alpha/beta hydrolase family esterase n=1 Tax=Paracoccus sp. TaxID=267 RepID=UPI003A84CC55